MLPTTVCHRNQTSLGLFPFTPPWKCHGCLFWRSSDQNSTSTHVKMLVGYSKILLHHHRRVWFCQFLQIFVPNFLCSMATQIWECGAFRAFGNQLYHSSEPDILNLPFERSMLLVQLSTYLRHNCIGVVGRIRVVIRGMDTSTCCRLSIFIPGALY